MTYSTESTSKIRTSELSLDQLDEVSGGTKISFLGVTLYESTPAPRDVSTGMPTGKRLHTP